SLNHYDVTTAATGYVTLRDDAPPSTAARTPLVAGQTFNTVIRMYKPATIYIVPKNPDGSAYTGNATATIGSSRGTQTFSVSGGPGSNILLTGTTDASGLAVFSVPSNSVPGYTTGATLGALTGTASGAVTATVTRTVTIR